MKFQKFATGSFNNFKPTEHARAVVQLEDFLKSDGSYDENINIHQLYNYAIDTLHLEKEKGLQKIRDKLNHLTAQINTGNYYSQEELISLHQTKSKCEKLLVSDIPDQRIIAFSQDFAPHYQSWKTLDIQQQHVLVSNFRSLKDRENIVKKCIAVIHSYSILFPAQFKSLNPDGCPECGALIIEEEDDASFICSNSCGYYMTYNFKQNEYVENALSKSDNGYHNDDTFIKTLDAHLGRIIMDNVDEVIDKFDTYCRQQGIDVKTMDWDFPQTQLVFKAIGCTKYHLIPYFLNWHPDIQKPYCREMTTKRRQLLEDYYQYNRIFVDNNKYGRQSGVSAQYVLFRLCQHQNIACREQDFGVPKDHAEIKKIVDDIFLRLGWASLEKQ